MNRLVLFITFVVVAILFVFGKYSEDKRRRKRTANFIEKQSFRRNGQLVHTEGGFFPTLKFLHRGVEVVVGSYAGSTKTAPSVKIHINILTYRVCKLLIHKLSIKVPAHQGELMRTKMNNHAFDSRLVVKTDDQMFIQNLISLSLQNKLLSHGGYPIEIDFRKDKMVVAMPKLPKTEQGYNSLIEVALGFYDRLKEIGENEGII